MKASTICGSDIRCIYHEHLGKGPEGYQDVVAGHELLRPDREDRTEAAAGSRRATASSSITSPVAASAMIAGVVT